MKLPTGPTSRRALVILSAASLLAGSLASPVLAATTAGTDVLAGADALSEVSIDVNPTNPDNLVIVGHEPGGFENMNTFFTTDGGDTWTERNLGDAQDAVVDVLDTLLLLFIVVELLFAVRATLVNRELVAEPFLLVGIIASIKEIVVLSVKAAEDIGKGAQFLDQLRVIGVLGVLVFLLGATSWMLRRKEREPAEGDGPNSGPATEDG